MPVLNGVSMNYGDAGSFSLVNSTITKGVYAVTDTSPGAVNPVNLELGTNGTMTFAVNGGGTTQDPSYLELGETYLTQSNVFNFRAVGDNKQISLQPSDCNATVYLGDAKIYSDVDGVYLGSSTKKLNVVTTEMKLSGPLQTLEDLRAEKAVYTRDMNITKTFQQGASSNIVGYRFCVGNDDTLLLVKYDSNNNSSKLITSFGLGNIDLDEGYGVPTYSGSAPTIGAAGTISGTDGFWENNGNFIHYGAVGAEAQYVGIGTSNPSTNLDVIGTIKGTKLTDGTIDIENGFITNVTSITTDFIIFSEGFSWNGHASNIHDISTLNLSLFVNDMDLADFYKGTSQTWFDKAPGTINLSSFNNDLLNLGGTAVFTDITADDITACNYIADHIRTNTLEALTSITTIQTNSSNLVVQETITTSNFTTNIMTTTNITVDSNLIANTVTVSDAFVQTELSVPTVYAQTINTDNLTTMYNLITSNLQTQIATVVNDLVTCNLTLTGQITGDLIPSSNGAYSFGSPSNRWHDFYLTGDTIYLGDTVLKSTVDESGNPTFTLSGGAFKTDKIIFPDDTFIQSKNDFFVALADGGLFGDFSSFTISIDTTNETIDTFSGTYKYSSNFSTVVHGNSWKIYHFDNNTIIPINSIGDSFDKSKGDEVKTGTSPNDVQVSFIHNSALVGEDIYFTPEQGSNMNQLFPLRNYDPYSKFFKNKLKSDYLYYFNERLLDLDQKATGKTVYSSNEVTNTFAQLNNPTQYSINSLGKLFDVEYMYYYNSPLYSAGLIYDNYTNEYFISGDSSTRLDKAYKYNSSSNAYLLESINDNYGLYPTIAIKRWENTANDPTFADILYNDSMLWGSPTPNKGTVYNRFNSNGWLKELFKITYKYVKYGDITQLVDGDTVLSDLDTYYSSVTSNSIVFLSESTIINNNNQIVENNTAFRLDKTIFSNLI